MDELINTDLPFLAAETAVDIDNILKKGEGDRESARTLSEQLTGFLLQSSIDPITLSILAEALLKMEGSEESLSDTEFLGEILQITNILRRIADGSPVLDQELERAMNFCTSLSQVAMSWLMANESRRFVEQFI